MKKITVSLIVSAVTIIGLSGLTSVMAQTGIDIRQKDIRQDARQQIQETRQGVREEVKGLRQNVQEEIKQSREAIKKEFEAKRTEAKNLLESKKEEFKIKAEAKRKEVKSKIEAKKTELKERLVKIKDERKKQIIERIYNQVNELNKRRLDHFSAVLEKLEKVLDRISNRAAKAEANGVDIAAVKIAITEATNAIAASRTAIVNQAGKVYTLVIGAEDALKTDIGKIRRALHDDLTVVQETVKTSREAVHKAATILAKIPKVNELEVEAATTTQSAQ
ncbi:hypothetical protein A3G50_01815 [Candidatus Jorgensenbacteria bacterium RIFCSPLOWO2_12_FULL_42_11]|uniref:Uncharacterized protein n=1 Tax=Candidatus Jorgensenbacteria bacterium RIFCSPLOWO2_12_FULL_42_11 TaxID=1798473 RepID=A0A1F6C1R5_9BACT|nr:MAG: hypothetical protein A3G50_01815 [Candidatus Jorgensenbacteria bacterium RIFCSPLOWO2_12_FULL_42_11]